MKDDFFLPIGKRIQEHRKQCALTQEQLSRIADVSYTTLTKVESGKIKNPSFDILKRIALAMGMSLDDLHMAQIYRGKNSVKRIWADILSTLQPGDTMYITGIDESQYLAADKRGIEKFIRDIKKAGLSQKLLSCEGDATQLEGDHIEYRWIPKKYFQPSPIYTYGDKVASLVWEPVQQSIILQNPQMADAYRRQFMFMWDNAIVPPK